MTQATFLRLVRTGLLAAGLALVGPGNLQAQESPTKLELAANNVHLAIVRHHWQVTIVESNYAALRPGSVYDMITYFEQNLGLSRPTFNYRFLDTGLGTADPLYPLYQKGSSGELLTSSGSNSVTSSTARKPRSFPRVKS